MADNKTQQTPLEALPESWQRYIKRLRNEAKLARQRENHLKALVDDLTRKLGGNPTAQQ